MSIHKLSSYLIFFLFICLSTFFLSCIADKQVGGRAPVDSARRVPQEQSRPVPNKYDINRKSTILLKGVWGDTIALYGCVGIFTGENPTNLRYPNVVNRLDKELDINIKKINFDEITEYTRSKLFSNGIQSISIQKSSLRQNSIGFFTEAGSDRIDLIKASKIYKTNWMGKAQLYEERLDFEFLTGGKFYNALFQITHGESQRPKTKWRIVDENRKILEKEQAVQLSGNVKTLIGNFCGQQGLAYLLPSTMCKKSASQ